MSKTKVAVIFGGRSGEHEVSLVSATSVIRALDRERYEVIEIGIKTDGIWLRGEGCLEKFKKQEYQGLEEIELSTDRKKIDFDIAFPVLHGPNGEDGTIQGLFESLQLPYVGCGVLGSATAMDKLLSKAIWEAAGLPVVPYLAVLRVVWEKKPQEVLNQVEEKIGLPCFVKPANMGSSVGVSKAKSREALESAINLAAKFDRRIVVEKALNVREIECAVLGNDEIVAAPVGEVLVGGEFYDFNDKYVDGKSSTQVPADIEDKTAEKIQKYCLEAYRLLDCCGLARVDTFIENETGDIYMNELNTMPGFTSISMYPKMMQAYGLEYPQLVDRLVELGFEKLKDKQKNQIIFDSGSDWFQK